MAACKCEPLTGNERPATDTGPGRVETGVVRKDRVASSGSHALAGPETGREGTGTGVVRELTAAALDTAIAVAGATAACAVEFVRAGVLVAFPAIAPGLSRPLLG